MSALSHWFKWPNISALCRPGRKQPIRNHLDSEQTSPAFHSSLTLSRSSSTENRYSHSNTPPHTHCSTGRKMEEFWALLLPSNGTAPFLHLRSCAAPAAGADLWAIISQLAVAMHTHIQGCRLKLLCFSFMIFIGWSSSRHSLIRHPV